MGALSRCGERKRNQYHDESMNVSIVSVSRSAGPPQVGHVVLMNAACDFRGLSPVGMKAASWGRTTGSWSSGTGTVPQSRQ